MNNVGFTINSVTFYTFVKNYTFVKYHFQLSALCKDVQCTCVVHFAIHFIVVSLNILCVF